MKENELVKLIQEMVMEQCGCTDMVPTEVVVGEPGPMAMTAPTMPHDAQMQIEHEPHEGYMVMQNLHKIHEYSGKLMAMLNESMDLPEWTEDKLATCADRMSSVFHYLEYKMGKG